MSNFTISIIGNKIFLEIINELKLFKDNEINLLDNVDLLINNNIFKDNIVLFFINKDNKKNLLKIKEKNFPILLITPKNLSGIKLTNNFVEEMIMPFRVIDLKTKITSLLAKYKFKFSSLINLKDYIIDKNERKIKKDDKELQLTEKETELLILFSNKKKSLTRNFILENVWKYSATTDTHTVETHIHRLRKKFLDKFQDSDFIKNNNQGYYI
tara:strand:+ start:2604 stop:3242 length:639 start_codon:yes stop_codon:yes gene_type:complete